MAWDIFDKLGNKVGEITKKESGDGIGCFFVFMAVFIVGGGGILFFPMLMETIFENPQAEFILWAAVFVLTPAICGTLMAKYSSMAAKQVYGYSFLITAILATISGTLLGLGELWMGLILSVIGAFPGSLISLIFFFLFKK